MPQAASTLPVRYGSDALLKVLADEGTPSVYLLAQAGVNDPRVVKIVQPPSGAAPDAVEGDIRCLCRMRSLHLTKVLDAVRVDDELGLVMEHVAGRSLAATLERAGSGTLLLPPELGVILAHDAFAAIEYFHDFERGSRVHGNITARTLMIDYAGAVKLVGYRPGMHPRAESDAQVGTDVMAVAELLGDLQFKMFPHELVQTLPRLLDEKLSGLEAMATAKAFVRGHVPSTGDRTIVARWLEEVFPGERERDAQDHARLVSAGLKLIGEQRGKPQRTESSEALVRKIAEHVVPVTQPAASVSSQVERPADEAPAAAALGQHQAVVVPRAASSSATMRLEGASSTRPWGPRLAVLGLAILVVLGGGWFLLHSEPSGDTGPEPLPMVSAAKLVPAVLDAALVPPPVDSGTEAGQSSEAGTTDTAAPDPEAALEAAEAAAAAEEAAAAVGRRHEKPAVARFLRAANAAFDRGERRKAVKLASRALAAGGGLRTHLTLARYLRSEHRYRDALAHYRAARKLDPDNEIAATGVKVLEDLHAESH